jgi:hypothetical protein
MNELQVPGTCSTADRAFTGFLIVPDLTGLPEMHDALLKLRMNGGSIIFSEEGPTEVGRV